MDTRCPICDSTDLDAREMPNDHPHHAKVRGRRCGRFVDWLPKPPGRSPTTASTPRGPAPHPSNWSGPRTQSAGPTQETAQ